MSNPREIALSEAFVELADTLVNDFDVVEFLHTLTVRCVELTKVDAAGLLLVDHAQRLRVVGSSSEQARLLELFEVQHDEGPCLDCYRTGGLVAEGRLRQSDLWPRFRRVALAAGFESVYAVPMRLRDEVIGSLNLFSTRHTSLDPAELGICQALADVATIGILQERAVREAHVLAGQLQAALDGRVVIEQAKGVLAERTGVGMADAFERLRRHARANNLRLVDVAEALIAGRLGVHDLHR